ncbi:unnamed protein product, partial [Rotaria socialis]
MINNYFKTVCVILLASLTQTLFGQNNVIQVSTSKELYAALSDALPKTIHISKRIEDVNQITLHSNQILVGDNEHAALIFRAGEEGIKLTENNTIKNLHVQTDPKKRAIFADVSVSNWGNLSIQTVTTIGQVQFLAKDKVTAGHVQINGLDIIYADVYDNKERPAAWNVYLLQGALTIYNMQKDPSVIITSEILNVSVGRR